MPESLTNLRAELQDVDQRLGLDDEHLEMTESEPNTVLILSQIRQSLIERINKTLIQSQYE